MGRKNQLMALQIDKRIQYLSVMSQVPSFRNTATTISPSRMGCAQRMPVDRGLEVCEFQTAQHWDLGNNQLRSTLGSRSPLLGCCWGAASGASFLSPKVWLVCNEGQKCVALGTDDSLQMQKCLLDEWNWGMGSMDPWRPKWWEPSNLVPNVSWWPFSIHRWLLLWLFPGFPFSLRWQIFSAAMALQWRIHQKLQRLSQCWQFQPMAMFVYLLFFIFFGTDKKRTRNKNVTIDLSLLSSKIFKDDNSSGIVDLSRYLRGMMFWHNVVEPCWACFF